MILALLRSWRHAAVPALLALAAIMAVSTWHAADPHDGRAVAVAVAAFDTAADAAPDASMMVHVAAHAIGHGMAMPQPTVALSPRIAAVQAWRRAATALPPGLVPASPMKPPRA